MNKITFLLLTLVMLQCKSTQNNVSTATLENTYWRLAEMNGKPIVIPADAKEVHVILSRTDAEKRVKGFAGCNTISGDYTIERNKIHFNIISTRMFCQDRMKVENFFIHALSKADRFAIVGEELTLYEGAEKLTTLESVYFK